MSFVLLGTLAINCAGDCYPGALLAAPFLYNAYGQNLYIDEFNWWFRLFTFLLIFGCNGTGLYGILKFKTSICKVTSYISVTVWFFVLVLMLLGSRNASIVAMRNSMSKAALEGKSLICSAAAAYFMQTLVIVPVNPDALNETQEVNRTDISEHQLPEFKQSAIKVVPDAPSPDKETESSSLSHYPSSKVVPRIPFEEAKRSAILKPRPHEEQPEDHKPSFGKPIPINSLTVKKFHGDKKSKKQGK